MSCRRIKICHVTSMHSPDDARIFHKECCSLAKHYDVSLIAPNIDDYEMRGVKVYGVNLPSSRNSRYFKLSSVFEKAMSINADIYHFHDPELLSLGLKIKKSGKHVIFDSHEDVPNQILTKEWIPRLIRKPLSKVYKIYEKYYLKHYDAIVSVTPILTERLKRINPNTYQVTNFPEYQEIKDDRKWGRKICFTGGISEKYMHHNILKAIEDVEVEYVLAGPCNPATYCEELQKMKSWSKVDFRGFVKREECVGIMQESTIGMAVLDYLPNVGYKKGTLGVLKIFEYMQAGIPIIATDFELWKEIIEGNGCGICVNPHKIDSIKNAVNYLLSNPNIAIRMGNNGRELVKKEYTWKSQEVELYKMYENIICNNYD
mgnify:CR=1 FL=1